MVIFSGGSSQQECQNYRDTILSLHYFYLVNMEKYYSLQDQLKIIVFV